MKRREFIKDSTYAACLLLCGMPFATGCMNYKVLNYEKENGKIRVKKSDFMENKAVVIKPTRSYAPIFLSKNDKEKYSAVLMVCTHMQCEVKPTGNLLTCPCHGAEFMLDGKLNKGPAARNLETFTTTTDENYIYIHFPNE